MEKNHSKMTSSTENCENSSKKPSSCSSKKISKEQPSASDCR